MMEAVFENLWKTSSDEDLALIQEFWDLRSEEFNEAVDKDNLNLTDYFQEKSFLDTSYDVLDIGCGVGKNLLKLACHVNHITGVDISPKMIGYAVENTAKRNLNNVSFKVIPWQKLNLKELKWNKKFDLVFASMSPAINSKEALDKMLEASRKYCFISGFVYRKDKVKDEIVKLISGERRNKGEMKSIYYAFNILWNMGIYPEITYKNTQWEKKLNSEAAIKMYTMQLRKSFNDDDIEEKVRSYINEISINNEIIEKVNAKVAWMSWEVQDEGAGFFRK